MRYSIFLVFILISITTLFSQELPRFRISVENTSTHVQTVAANDFAERLKESLKDQLKVEFYHSAELFRDKDVLQALALGKVEMAILGTWHIDKYVPEVGLFLLPMFYGRGAESNYMIMDSSIGIEINKRIENALQVEIVGRWIDLGRAHLFGRDMVIDSYADIQGKKIRVAGGIANSKRIDYLGGIPTTISWPDLPLKLENGIVDGVLTTYETIRSASLWEKGINYAFEDSEYFPQYVPVISGKFWKRLNSDIQQIIIAAWEENVDKARQNAADAQNRAKIILMQNGVSFSIPSNEEVINSRENLMQYQNIIAEQLGIDEKILNSTRQMLQLVE